MSYPIKLSPQLKTKSGKDITIGIGTGTQWKRPIDKLEGKNYSEELVNQLLFALDSGFNHIDTAEVYETQPAVGEAIKRTKIPREDLFITSKYNGGFLTFKAQSKSGKESVDKALRELGTDYIDLFLIHSPFFTTELSHGHTLEDIWKDLIEAKKEGKIREIGISNAAIPHLERLFAVSPGKEFYPKVNQIEFHAFLQNQSKDIVKYSQDHNILVEAFSPLSPITRAENKALNPFLKELSTEYKKTEAQILLRYILQRGVLPITTSANKDRIKQSLDLYDFELSDKEVEEIEKIGKENPFRAFFHEAFKNL
ncbi:uncharacterized protein KGF55_005127 [Candida pseudojiufengensis]|uniref:uncharacterized protein n=1 Tax=Candida pseudojiufengensis TaxID=497109 RepID=UPI0022257E58|nr:uncharacterized protein KGF55_005127 [Candida pseudojiufengensis]KAI5959895.1 hypothetical protein KGF55_005127 [Candida pseudojiufengensis]